jgi:hypothetical protein
MSLREKHVFVSWVNLQTALRSFPKGLQITKVIYHEGTLPVRFYKTRPST